MTITTNNVFLNKMENIFNSLKEQDLSYHVLVKYSGGKDSSYLLYLMKKKYNLIPLAFSVIHPFVNKQSIKNMKRVTSNLGIKWQPFMVDKKMFQQYLSYGVKNYQKYNSRYSLADLYGCRICCSVYNTVSYKRAMELKIPYVLDGSDFNQLGFPFLSEGSLMKKYLSDDPYYFGPFTEIIEDLFGKKYHNTIYDLNFERIKNNTFPGIIAPLSIINYNPEKAKLLLESKGFIKPADLTVEKTNCTIRHLFAHLSFKYFDQHPYQQHIFRMADSGMHGFSRENARVYFKELKQLLIYLAANLNLSDKGHVKFSSQFQHRKLLVSKLPF